MSLGKQCIFLNNEWRPYQIKRNANLCIISFLDLVSLFNINEYQFGRFVAHSTFPLKAVKVMFLVRPEVAVCFLSLEYSSLPLLHSYSLGSAKLQSRGSASLTIIIYFLWDGLIYVTLVCTWVCCCSPLPTINGHHRIEGCGSVLCPCIMTRTVLTASASVFTNHQEREVKN